MSSIPFRVDAWDGASRGLGAAAIVVMGLTSNACTGNEVREAFSRQFACAEQRVRVEELNTERYRVSGCYQSVIYNCWTGACKLEQEREPEPKDTPTGSDAGFARLDSRDDGTLVSLDVRLHPKVMLKLRAAPAEHGELAQLKLQRIETNESLTACRVDLLVNGNLLELPAPTRSHEKGKSSLVVNLPRDLVRELGLAEQVALRACSTRWSLTAHQLTHLRAFVARYEQELGWLGGSGKASGGLVAPSGGWPEWSSLGPRPESDSSGPVLNASDLFRKVSPSVLRVEGTRAAGSSQGSGVAVSTSDIATNCHVLEGALKIRVKLDKREWPARLKASEPKHDRCVLGIDEAVLTPIRGVRRYAELVIGEPLYTVGAPSGLELSLSDGLLSGLRQEAGVDYVQTTAPISPGSSGGPLFDARGNLVGVTTLVLVGKRHLNQSLNFAIAADAYWAP